MLSVFPCFVVLEMINDMTNVEDEHLQHQFHRIYIHRMRMSVSNKTPTSVSALGCSTTAVISVCLKCQLASCD